MVVAVRWKYSLVTRIAPRTHVELPRSSTGTAAAQDSTARLGVLLGFSLVPALLVGTAVVVLRPYRDGYPQAEVALPTPVRPVG